jgi:hypothetical protein
MPVGSIVRTLQMKTSRRVTGLVGWLKGCRVPEKPIYSNLFCRSFSARPALSFLWRSSSELREIALPTQFFWLIENDTDMLLIERNVTLSSFMTVERWFAVHPSCGD